MNFTPIVTVVDEIAEMLVLADSPDLSIMGRIHEKLGQIVEHAETLSLPRLAAICRHAQDKVEEAVLESGDELGPIVALCTSLINALQDMTSKDEFREEVFPGQLRIEVEGETEAEAPRAAAPENEGKAADTFDFGSDAELVAEFLTEAAEHLQNAEANLLTLEGDADDAEALNAVFRAFHTIKGGAGFLHLQQVQELAHESETLLDLARSGNLRMAEEYIDTTFDSIDYLKRLLRRAMSGGATDAEQDSLENLPGLIARIRGLAQGVKSGTAPTKHKPGKKLGEILVEDMAHAPELLEQALKQQEKAPNQRLGQILISSGKIPAKDVSHALRAQKEPAAAAAMAKESVKVDADRLDRLVDLIGELVIAETMVAQAAMTQPGASQDTARYLNQLNKITRELQEIGTSLRMVPLRGTFQKMARLVRDVSKKSTKTVDLIIEGDQHELDKAVVDQIGDPLMHMLRNAVDHGLEASAEERTRAGKPPTGKVFLRAYYKGSNIHIEVADDGRGLNREAILRKARERGLLSEGAQLSDSEIWDLIFHPGFSTAEVITDVSGRGVGMDVVKKSITALRGQIEIHSEAGRGTTFNIRLPLTLAIIDGMVIRVGEERFIIPTLSVVTALRPAAGTVKTVLDQGEIIIFREKPIPLVRLGSLLEVAGAGTNPEQAILLVVESGNRAVAFMCDELLGQQQTVIKTLGHALQGLSGISGSAIMPDGRAGIILDVEGLIRAIDRVQSPDAYLPGRAAEVNV